MEHEEREILKEQAAVKNRQVMADAQREIEKQFAETLQKRRECVPEEPGDDAPEVAAIAEQHTQQLQYYFRRLELGLTDADILKVWKNRHQRRFRLRIGTVNVPREQNYPVKFQVFTPLINPRLRLVNAGFFTKYIDNPPFKLREGLLQQKKKLFQSFIVHGREARSFYICGDLGVGKSTFMGSIAMALITFLDIQIHYITMPRLLRLITSIDSEDREKVALLERCPFLFIDDIGHEKYTTDNQESVMREFFVYRYGNELSTFLAGNGNIVERAGSNSFYRQLADYINESCVWTLCEVSGESYRGAAGRGLGAV